MNNIYFKHNNGSGWGWLLMTMLGFIITILVISIILTGCSSAKELMDKAERKDPAVVAEYARDKYPCAQLLKTDTAMIFKDTTVYIECPDSMPTVFETVRVDTLNSVITRVVKVPVNIKVPGQVITRWFEDSAKLKLYHLQVENLQKDTATLRADRDKFKGKADHRSKENWIWRLIATALICWQVFKLYRRLTTIKIA